MNNQFEIENRSMWVVVRHIETEPRHHMKFYHHCSEAIEFCKKYTSEDIILTWTRMSLLEWKHFSSDLTAHLTIEHIFTE